MVSQSVMSMWGGLIFGNDNPTTLPGWKRAVVIVLNNIIPLLLAMFLPTAKPILSIGGALGGCIVDFIFPSLMYIVYYWKDSNKFGFKYIVLYLCTLFGAVTGVIATYQAVIDAIDSLKENYKTAVILFYFQELKIKEIARIMGIPDGNVKVCLYRAKKQLKNLLSNQTTQRKEGLRYAK